MPHKLPVCQSAAQGRQFQRRCLGIAPVKVGRIRSTSQQVIFQELKSISDYQERILVFHEDPCSIPEQVRLVIFGGPSGSLTKPNKDTEAPPNLRPAAIAAWSILPSLFGELTKGGHSESLVANVAEKSSLPRLSRLKSALWIDNSDKPKARDNPAGVAHNL